VGWLGQHIDVGWHGVWNVVSSKGKGRMNGTLAHAELMWCYGMAAWRIEGGFFGGSGWLNHELIGGSPAFPLTSYADRRRYYSPSGTPYSGKKRDGLEAHHLYDLGIVTTDPKRPHVSEAHNWLAITGFNEGHSFR